MSSPVIVNPEADEFVRLRVGRKEQVARDTFLFELRDPAGGELAGFTPGSHVTVEVPSGSRRNYSICSDPAQRAFYEIAVKRDPNGRGGSVSMADEVHAGSLLPVSPPRNNFEMSERARRFVFIAGGIGITPILSMMRHLKRSGDRPFTLYYLTRDAQGSAFLEHLQQEFGEQFAVHHDNGDREQAFDLWPVLERPGPAAHVYCCGPRALMDSVQGMTGHWGSGTVHFESFGAGPAAHAENRPFKVELHRSQRIVEVGANESILEALRRSAVHVASSCESGTCGSCRTALLGGEAEHRDAVLGEHEQASEIMVCVSRARSAVLVLDL